jgi:pimeloyl-ACP methyl ester carboxylesterase
MAVMTLVLLCLGAEAQAQGAYADLPGVRLWFVDTGGAGVPLVLLHANTGTSDSWKHQYEPFSRAGYRVIAFDRRGWGRSLAQPASGPQPGSVAADLQALVEYLHLDRFYLVGVAGGGFVALDYAAWHPEKIIAMVVAASTGQMSESDIRDYSARITIPGLAQQHVRFREIGASYRGADPDGVVEWTSIEEHAQQAGAPAQPLHTPNTYAKIETIPTPVLALAGDADLIAPPGLMSLWASHLKNGRFDFVPDAGHSIAWERPDEFNPKVLAFFDAHPVPR